MMKIVALVAVLCILHVSGSPIEVFQKAVHPKDLPIPQSRIVNGQLVAPQQLPHQAVILSSIFALCGGSLISTRWVLTAAHCLNPAHTYTVGLGSVNRINQLFTYNAITPIRHPLYNPTTLNNDIGLLQLPVDVPLSANVQPIRLPANSQANAPFLGVTALASGFGFISDFNQIVSNELRYAQMTVISNDECASIFGGNVVVGHVLCARGTLPANQGTCNGDTGGPLTLMEGIPSVPTQIGVISFVAMAGCEAGFPSGYMRTASFLQWIQQQTAIPIRP